MNQSNFYVVLFRIKGSCSKHLSLFYKALLFKKKTRVEASMGK